MLFASNCRSHHEPLTLRSNLGETIKTKGKKLYKLLPWNKIEVKVAKYRSHQLRILTIVGEIQNGP